MGLGNKGSVLLATMIIFVLVAGALTIVLKQHSFSINKSFEIVKRKQEADVIKYAFFTVDCVATLIAMPKPPMDCQTTPFDLLGKSTGTSIALPSTVKSNLAFPGRIVSQTEYPVRAFCKKPPSKGDSSLDFILEIKRSGNQWERLQTPFRCPIQ